MSILSAASDCSGRSLSHTARAAPYDLDVRSLLVRFGLAAIWTVYLALGVVSARVALLGARDRETGVPGALVFLLRRPFGPKLLGAVVAGLTGLAAVRLVEAFGRGRRRKVWARAGLA